MSGLARTTRNRCGTFANRDAASLYQGRSDAGSRVTPSNRPANSAGSIGGEVGHINAVSGDVGTRLDETHRVQRDRQDEGSLGERECAKQRLDMEPVGNFHGAAQLVGSR